MNSKAGKVARMGLLFALSMVLSLVEGALPALPMLPPGMKLGLSNVVVMYCLFFLNAPCAYVLAVLKALFVFLVRGFTAGLLSLCGGLLSVTVMLLCLQLKRLNLTYLSISIAGAVCHNLGQTAAASLLLGSGMVLYYLPVVLCSGVVMGLLTGLVLKASMPLFQHIQR